LGATSGLKRTWSKFNAFDNIKAAALSIVYENVQLSYKRPGCVHFRTHLNNTENEKCNERKARRAQMALAF